MNWSEILWRNIEVLIRLELAFQDSIEHIKSIDVSNLKTFREYEPVDAFFDRFERIIDNLFQSTFRTLYEIENLSSPLSLMDLSSFIVNIKIVDNIEKLIELKDLRNKIAHEYIWLGIYQTEEFINQVNNYKDDLFQIIENVKTYSWKYLKD